MQRERLVGLRLRDIGVGHPRPVDDIDAAGAEHPAGPAFDDDGGVLVDADAEHPGVLGHRAQQPADPAALGEVLVDDHPVDQAEAGGHVEIADPVGFRAGSAHQHGVAHHRGAGGGAGHHAAPGVKLPDEMLDRGVADLARDA